MIKLYELETGTIINLYNISYITVVRKYGDNIYEYYINLIADPKPLCIYFKGYDAEDKATDSRNKLIERINSITGGI